MSRIEIFVISFLQMMSIGRGKEHNWTALENRDKVKNIWNTAG